jgi:hypothetical protein
MIPAMQFTFRTETVLSALTTLRSLENPVNSLEELTSRAAPAMTALDLFPEISLFLRALHQQIGRPETNLLFLKRKADEIASRFEKIFPPDQEHNLSDLGRAHLRSDVCPSSPFDLILRATDPSIPFGDLPRIILGGFFVFSRGEWAEIRWDTRLIEGLPPLPLSIPHLHPSANRKTIFLRRPAPVDWRGVLTYRDYLREMRGLSPDVRRLTYNPEEGYAASVEADFNRLLLKTRVSFPHDGENIEISSQTFYELDGRKTQKGVLFKIKPDRPYVTSHRWEIIESGKWSDYLLEPRVSQFFFLPGAVWEVKGHRGGIEDFDAAALTEKKVPASIQIIPVTKENAKSVEEHVTCASHSGRKRF